VLAHNLNHKQKDIKLFEFGKVYAKTEKGYAEHKRLALFITGAKESANLKNRAQPVAYFHLASSVNKILNKLTDLDFTQASTQSGYFESGLDLKKGEKVVASIGKLSKKVLKLADIRQEVFYADIHWELLLKQSGKPVVYQEVSRFPEV